MMGGEGAQPDSRQNSSWITILKWLCRRHQLRVVEDGVRGVARY
jgi:hypothetical protein